jgi:hypothetical protein
MLTFKLAGGDEMEKRTVAYFESNSKWRREGGSRGRRARSGEQRAGSGEQRSEGREQCAES